MEIVCSGCRDIQVITSSLELVIQRGDRAHNFEAYGQATWSSVSLTRDQ